MNFIYLKKTLRNIVSEKQYDFVRLTYRIIKLMLNFHDANNYIIRFQKKIIKSDDIIFDIGSNRGFFTYNYLKIAKDGFVYSFEPVKRTFDLQERLLRKFNLKNYKLNNFALGNMEGEIEFIMPKSGNYSKDTSATIRTEGAFKHFAEKEIIKIPCLKINSIIEKENIQKADFVKIDVEGAELLVFQGGEKLLKMQPIIFAELLERHFEKFGYTVKDFINFLKNYNYKPYFFSQKEELLVSGDNNENTNQSDCYFIPASKELELITNGIILR